MADRYEEDEKEEEGGGRKHGTCLLTGGRTHGRTDGATERQGRAGTGDDYNCISLTYSIFIGHHQDKVQG